MSAKQGDKQSLEALEALRKRLLDLTARNRLINYRHSKRGCLRIIDELPDQLVQVLIEGKEMSFVPVPEPKREQLIKAGYINIDDKTGREVQLKKAPTAEEWAKYLGLTISYEVPRPSNGSRPDKHSDLSIQTLLYPYELEVRLKELLQTAESAIQEMGANILYLGFGFLEWYESTNDDNPRIAPLFLVPARLAKGRLNKKTRTYEYTLSYSDEDLLPNLSLREKLRADFSMALPGLDEGTLPEYYFREVEELIKENQPRWRVRRYITLSLLNFSKLLMYLDLDPSRWPDDKRINKHPTVKRFLDGYGSDPIAEDAGGQNLGFGEEHSIDELEDIHDEYPLIDDADSSQHSALIDAIDGKNLVIEGPPGTGKSQTITNLIAAAMARGKRVLFVAEKLAALEVVRRRLDAAGLGCFCLELHSHKTQKRKVLDEIEQRIKMSGKWRKPKAINVEITRFEELKSTLKAHVERVNEQWKKTGVTKHEIFMAATRYRATVGVGLESLHPEVGSGKTFDLATQRRIEDQVDAYGKVYQAVAEQLAEGAALQDHPWYGVRNSDLQLFDLPRVSEALANWQASLEALNSLGRDVYHELGSGDEYAGDSISNLALVHDDLNRLPVLEGSELLELLPVLRGDVRKDVSRYIDLYEEIQASYTELSGVIGTKILEDLAKTDNYTSGIELLQRYVGQAADLGVLAEALRDLKVANKRLSDLVEPIEKIQSVLGEEAARFLTLSMNGLKEFQILLEVVRQLDTTHVKLRDPLYDNVDLDTLLPKLRSELEPLRELHEILFRTFDIDKLPDKSVLLRLKDTLDAGGIFCWFKGEWRAARKAILGYATSNQVRLSTLHSQLEQCAEYAHRIKILAGNRSYKDALGEHYRDLDTDIDTLETLRAWYTNVRKEYGIGFGRRVDLGNAVLQLPSDIIHGIRSLHDQGTHKELATISKRLTSLEDIFKPYAAYRDHDAPYLGRSGTLTTLLGETGEAIRLCKPLLTDARLTIEEVYGRIQSIKALRDQVIQWEGCQVARDVISSHIHLKTGINADGAGDVICIRNTLSLAVVLDQDLAVDAVRSRIYHEPTKATFDTLSQYLIRLKNALDECKSAKNVFTKIVQLDDDDWMGQSGDEIDLLMARNRQAQETEQTLSNWVDYIRLREQLAGHGLTNLAVLAEQRELDITKIVMAYKAGLYDLLSREILREEPKLGRFSGHSHEALRAQFIEYDNRLKQLQRERIAWQIGRNDVPLGNHGARVSEHTDLHLLNHECSKKKRHIPIRQLVERAGLALVALKPCFMMGPMSVAQYLTPGQIEFDLIVMDEASQIRPQEALGAIARGTQLVIVGDPKQLPPTSFFERAIDDDNTEDTTAIEESESILDATIPMFDARRLRWHYRSQDESLIAFSNHSYYDSDLVIFPSPHVDNDDFGVQYSRVERGCFVNRRNTEEARIIAESVREHFRHHSDETLGVVAMSAEQRLQIEIAIEVLAKNDSVFRTLLEKDASRHEAMFVKNLENVQGDERDVIYISMTYGPPELGQKVYQRFGPINSDVGWRRLNVLFTRSKKRMHIFSSMGSGDIIVDGNSKRGVKSLGEFLRYCETGELHKVERDSGRDPDSDFEVAVMDMLMRAGYECVPQVGVAGYYIDVAVVDPGSPGRYLMGIECDGATYHSAKSVRDRDRLRQAILERLGWRIRRIWSTDWFKNPQNEMQPILRELNKLRTPVEIKREKAVVTDKAEISRIVKVGDIRESVVDRYMTVDRSLEDALADYDNDVVRQALPDTLDNQRLLRPSMIEAFLEYHPINQSEYYELMPAYLREATSALELHYLDGVLEIINSSVGFKLTSD